MRSPSLLTTSLRNVLNPARRFWGIPGVVLVGVGLLRDAGVQQAEEVPLEPELRRAVAELVDDARDHADVLATLEPGGRAWLTTGGPADDIETERVEGRGAQPRCAEAEL